ncbi:E3 ubiquitin-protein ligase TRIM69-like isoform X2 [Latimeria chalumnae]|uniref:E3 ubiquitin-protein ligase TRIM69-like isoform X2 n=1 Tax=Latimeria chalumnae TaxID=7897 RepID=UPI00313B7088
MSSMNRGPGSSSVEAQGDFHFHREVSSYTVETQGGFHFYRGASSSGEEALGAPQTEDWAAKCVGLRGSPLTQKTPWLGVEGQGDLHLNRGLCGSSMNTQRDVHLHKGLEVPNRTQVLVAEWRHECSAKTILAFKIKKYADYKPRAPGAVSAADIDGYKYTDCLQYRVGKKMLIINRVTVTLDPNTAHPVLKVTKDRTTVTWGSTRRKTILDNPKRFDGWPCVLGSEGFTSGRHSWVVDVGKQTDCILGVTAESANRKGDVYLKLKPECGYWTIQLDEGDCFAFTDERWTQLKVLKTSKKVLVYVDYEAGKISFSNADDRSHIYTFIHKFKHKIFPFFCPLTEGAPLRICNL